MKSAVHIGAGILILGFLSVGASAQQAEGRRQWDPAKRAQFHQMREQVKAACAGDAQTLCPNLEGRERHKCMFQNRDKLSQGCQQAMAQFPRHRHHRPDGAAPQAAATANENGAMTFGPAPDAAR